MNVQFNIRQKDSSKLAREILEDLPNWFGDQESRENYVKACTDLPCISARVDGVNAGILAIKIHDQTNAEIFFMGVASKFHRSGIGKELVNMAANIAIKRSISILTVKTLWARSSDPFYAKTRAFYESVGFQPFEELPTLWGKNAPCLLMAMNLDRVQ